VFSGTRTCITAEAAGKLNGQREAKEELIMKDVPFADIKSV
jgi:hypothetical protein